MPANRCLVSSLTALLHRSGRWDRDILIFVDAMDALTKDGTFGVLTSWQGWRVLGLAPLQKLLELTPYESLYLESLFGPVVQIVGSAAEQVRVALLPKPHLAVAERCDSDRGLASALERKRALIWRDQTRNRWLAELACAIQQRGLAALPSASTFPTSRPSSDCSLHRIALLVESPEHGDLLRSYLPTWPVYDRHAVTGDQNSGASLPAIVTAAFAHQHSADADVWIRADRGELGVDLLDLRPTRLRERESPTLLVDFAEDGSLTSGERLRSYLLRGWRLIQGLEHFVERRSAGPPVPVDQLPVRNWYREQLQHGAQDLSELISVG